MLKKIIKILLIFTAMTFMITSLTINSSADTIKTINGYGYRLTDNLKNLGKYTGWAHNNKGTQYWLDGVLLTDKWIKTSKGVFYLNNDGIKQLGWLHLKDNWYYIDETCGKITDTKIINGYSYVFEDDGRWNKSNIYKGNDYTYLYLKIQSKLDNKSYGGIYVLDGMIIIWSVDKLAEKKVQELLPDVGGIIYKPATYSMAEMKKIVKKICNNQKYKFSYIFVDECSNKIKLGVTQKQYEKIKTYIKNLPNNQMIDIIIVTDGIFIDD